MKLRAPEPSDIDFLFQCENHPDRLLHGRSGLLLSRHQLETYVHNYHERSLASGHIRFIIDSFNMQAGIIDLYEIDHSSRKAFVAIYIDEPFRRKGIGTAALNETIGFARDEMGLFQLVATVSSANMPSQCLFKKLRFSQIALLPKWVRNIDGTLIPAILYNKILEF